MQKILGYVRHELLINVIKHTETLQLKIINRQCESKNHPLLGMNGENQAISYRSLMMRCLAQVANA